MRGPVTQEQWRQAGTEPLSEGGSRGVPTGTRSKEARALVCSLLLASQTPIPAAQPWAAGMGLLPGQ